MNKEKTERRFHIPQPHKETSNTYYTVHVLYCMYTVTNTKNKKIRKRGL